MAFSIESSPQAGPCVDRGGQLVDSRPCEGESSLANSDDDLGYAGVVFFDVVVFDLWGTIFSYGLDLWLLLMRGLAFGAVGAVDGYDLATTRDEGVGFSCNAGAIRCDL